MCLGGIEWMPEGDLPEISRGYVGELIFTCPIYYLELDPRFVEEIFSKTLLSLSTGMDAPDPSPPLKLELEIKRIKYQRKMEEMGL